MQSLTRKQFNQRWAKAQQKNELAASLKAAPVKLNLTLDTLLDNYEKQVNQALAAHAIDEAQCQRICAAVAELKAATKPASTALKPFLVV